MANIQNDYNVYSERLKMRNEEIANLKKSYDLKPKKEPKMKKPKKERQ